MINAQWKDSDEKQDFTFLWIDKENMIGKWTTSYSSGWTTDYNYTTLDNQLAFPNIDQPCSECWGDECDFFPIEIIRKIFEDYVKYNESTDSEDDKMAILENIRKINYTPGVNDYLLLINVMCGCIMTQPILPYNLIFMGFLNKILRKA